MNNEIKQRETLVSAYDLLQDVDGDTLQNVIELLGMREQMLRQLVMTADPIELDILMDERFNN
jgi:hypothetical protein